MEAASRSQRVRTDLAMAARQGESRVEESLRGWMKESPEQVTAAASAAMLDQDVSRLPIWPVDVEPMSLAGFD
jgi:hypothetical protein